MSRAKSSNDKRSTLPWVFTFGRARDRRLLSVRVEAEEHVGAALVAARGQVGDAAGPGQRLGDLAGGVDAADLDEARAALLEGLGDRRGGLGLALGADDRGLLLLLGLGDDVGLALGLLLGDLLLLDGRRELLAEDEVRDRDVVQYNVEVVRALC